MAYADLNYDPKKAHEYYEKHKKLKGKRSTKGFSDTQKEQWAYAKDQLKEQHKANNADIADWKKAQMTATSENTKRIKEQLTQKASAQVDALREKLKNMPKEQKAEMREKIQGVISNIRASVKAQKTQATEKGKEVKANVKETATSLKKSEKANYEAKVDEAYNRIKGAG